MSSTTKTTTKTPAAPLAVRGPEAAHLLGIGVRKLDELKAGGHLPIVKVGAAVLFPVDGLRAYLAAATTPARSGPLAEGGGVERHFHPVTKSNGRGCTPCAGRVTGAPAWATVPA